MCVCVMISFMVLMCLCVCVSVCVCWFVRMCVFSMSVCITVRYFVLVITNEC